MTKAWAIVAAFSALVCVLVVPGSAWAATAPVNAAIPTIAGTAREGQTLTASSGSWGGSLPISYAYAWARCDDAGAGCASIKGAGGPTYKLTSSDVGHSVRVKVTASNGAGSASVFSAQTGSSRRRVPRPRPPGSRARAARRRSGSH